MGYDIIGDVHGEAAMLEALLRDLGYEDRGGTWRHPERTAVFVGDFIDRGPEQLRAVGIVRRMIDAGAALAVMGNHELNAIAWHTPRDDGSGDWCRTHAGDKGKKNFRQHARFLDEVGGDLALHDELVAWFRTLPLWLHLPGFRVVHACWHEPQLDVLARELPDARLPDDRLAASLVKPRTPEEHASPAFALAHAVQTVTSGLEASLPEGRTFADRDGNPRRDVRLKWWDASATTFLEAALVLCEAERAAMPDLPIPVHARVRVEGAPVFFGHYWLPGGPALSSPQLTCLDFQEERRPILTAYRFDGETELSAGKLVSVGPRRS
ncbi:metallophosphatase [Luteitalea sp. TBR-22]|uniref:metallophosphoesterase n=1 Tax=Luteitalea sp. TBR-22 TaxID=2802971 RepID=UPI001AF081C1|nr:metallophosphoesterase [Luteitalea sp. TBR-22]BCS35972.1 metallophosphatase [Luteitalea sp. TBR-22]